MTSIDLRDAYYSVPIRPEHRKYLKFIWQGVALKSHVNRKYGLLELEIKRALP